MKKFFIISWNEEYLEANLVGGPFEETECEQELCQCLLTGLVKLGVASDETEAQSMYDATAGSDMPSETLSVHSTGGSIRYGTGYTEFYQIRFCDIPVIKGNVQLPE